jgi:hypothetical protein
MMAPYAPLCSLDFCSPLSLVTRHNSLGALGDSERRVVNFFLMSLSAKPTAATAATAA